MLGFCESYLMILLTFIRILNVFDVYERDGLGGLKKEFKNLDLVKGPNHKNKLAKLISVRSGTLGTFLFWEYKKYY